MIEITITASFDLIEDIDQFAQAFDERTKQVSLGIERQFARPLLAELRIEPGKPKLPIRWKNEDQRIFVLIKLRKEGNLPYRRSSNLALGWVSDVVRDEDGIVFDIANPTEYAVYVYGALNTFDTSEAIKPQQPFHQDTGWQLAVNTIAPYGEDAFAYANRELVDNFAPFVKSNVKRGS